MTHYTPSDFTEIFGPDEKPVRPGWYVSCTSRVAVRYCRRSTMNTFLVCKWTGKKWAAHNQSRYWFGLRKPT